MTQPRVLIYDIETAPNRGYIWGKWQQNVIKFTNHWYILTVSWKWLGETAVHVEGLDDYENYVEGSEDDSALAWLLYDLFEEADIAITHNGNAFDQPKARTRMEVHRIPPPSPFKEIDTLKVARKHFAFASNSLEDLCAQLGLDLKGKPGWNVWEGCMEGDPAAWRKMKRYNRNDVKILEQLYLRFLPWIEGHPNLALMSDKPNACPRCLVEGKMKSWGWRYYQVTKRRRWRCLACNAFTYGRTLQKSDVARVP